MQVITRRLKREKRGISTVIVVMLSLVLLVIIVGNVVLWSYQMNQFDWERLNENVAITDVSHVNGSSWSVAQSEYAINIGSKITGTYADTQDIDDQYESFTEGLNWWNTNYDYRRQINIVNNEAATLDAGYSVGVTMDTASLFSEGKMRPNGRDLRVVYWSGSTWNELDRDAIDVNSASTQIWFKMQTSIDASSADNNYYIYYGNPSSGSPPANKSNVYLWFDDFDRANKADITTEASYSVKTGGGTWAIDHDTLKNVGASGDPNKLIITALGDVNTAVDMLVKIRVTSLAGGDLSRMGLSCCIDASPSAGSGYCSLFHDDTNSLDLLNDLRSWGTQGTYSWSLDTWYYMRFRVVDPESRVGQIKVWQVGTDEPSTLTVDGSFGSGTVRSYGEVGFAGSRTTDTTYFDDITIRFIADSEPSTSMDSEESQGNNRLDITGTFSIDLSTYSLSSITNVEMHLRYRPSDTGEKWYLKVYNWTSSTYSDNGFNSTAGHTPTTGWNYYTVNLTDCWVSYINSNGTVHVKIVDAGADDDPTVLDIDFLAVKIEIDGVLFTFENHGSVTSHLVSLWVSNSTLHQRYSIDVIINSGDVASNFRGDIGLSDDSFIIKVVTERGNTAVFSED